MTIEALPRIQQPQTYIGPEERTGRNKTLLHIAAISVVLGTGVLLAPFFTAFSLTAGLITGISIVVLSLYSIGYLSSIDSDKDLIKAAIKGDLCKVKFLLFLGANPNVCDTEENVASPLHGTVMIFGTNPKIIDALMNSGADPNIRLANLTPLQIAATMHLDAAVEKLLEHGADPLIEMDGVSSVQIANMFRDQFANPAFDHPHEDDLRTREERKAAADKIAEMMGAHNQPGRE